MRRWVGIGLALVVGAACDCGGGLRGGGATPYVRCLVDEPPPSGRWRVGELELALKERVLGIEGLPETVRLVAFGGPAFARAPLEPALRELRAYDPHLALVIGGLGDDEARLRATLRALAAQPWPSLLLAGGREVWARQREALAVLRAEHGRRVIDVSTLREVRMGEHTWLPVPGAPDGHYARGDGACGYDASSLEARSEDLRPPGPDESRWLLAWHAPAGAGSPAVAATDRGLDLGDPALAAFGDEAGVRGGVFAWPRVQLMRPSATLAGALWLVVPSLAGPAAVRDDGSTPPTGAACLSLTPRALRLQPDCALAAP